MSAIDAGKLRELINAAGQEADDVRYYSGTSSSYLPHANALANASATALPELLDRIEADAARIAELEAGLKPFANAARDLDATAPDGKDDGLTVLAYIHSRSEQEAVLSTAHFAAARALLQGPTDAG